MPGATIPHDLLAPLTTRNLRPRSRATSMSRSEVVSAAASRSHSPSSAFSRQSPYLYHPMHPPESDIESQLRSFPAISMDQSDPWGPEFANSAFMTDSISMNPHTASSSMSFDNFTDPQPMRSRKLLFADSADPMPPRPSSIPGSSTQSFYHQGQSSDAFAAYGLETMPGLKRKREESVESIESWFNNQKPTIPMSMPIELLDDDPSPGPSYVSSRDRKGKGKEIDYKGKGKQREEIPQDPILITDSPILESLKPLPTTAQIPPKPLSEPLSSYTCPICFSAPTNATLTPCGHICCGECLFTAVKTVMHRAQQAGAPDAQEARCPVCRALIPDWDGKGAGVIGLKARAIFSL